MLQEMWERGAKAPVIAAALGCKVGAVNVARARFGLRPRRAVSGRPKQEPDEPAHKIERVAFTTSRLMEFCTEKELVAQTGHESYEWLRVVIKELVDNAMDAGEEAEIAPVIKVTITTGKRGRPTRIVVEDNGPGIPPAIITDIIDYNVRVSSREAYISPTRGRQGNALKTILPMSYVLGGKIKGETWIEARGVKHQILFTVNQIKQEPIVKDIRSRSKVTIGTRITIFWPDRYKTKIDANEIAALLMQFVWVNPHLTLRFVLNGKTLIQWKATNPAWKKYRACDATSAHWYTPEQFERYAGALIDRDEVKNNQKENQSQALRRPVPRHELDRKAEAGSARTRRVAHVAAVVLSDPRREVNHRPHEQAAAPATAAYAPSPRGNCSASSARSICGELLHRPSAASRRASSISSALAMTPTACPT